MKRYFYCILFLTILFLVVILGGRDFYRQGSRCDSFISK